MVASRREDGRPGIANIIAALIEGGAIINLENDNGQTALHRALRYYIKAPTELIIYPEAGHGLTTYPHRLAKMKWDHAWFDRYLLGKESAPEAEDGKKDRGD